MTENEYIEERLEDQINWYDTKSGWNQKWFRRAQALQIVFAASIPVLVNYVTDTSDWVRIIVAILGASIAIVSGLAGLYKFQENWLEYRTTCESLRHERFLFLTKTDSYSVEDPFPILVNNVEALISKEHTKWAQSMKPVEKGEKKTTEQP